VDEEEEALQSKDGSKQNVEDSGHSRFHQRTNNVEGYQGEDGDDAEQEEQALHAD
jgi:hypothetical protein